MENLDFLGCVVLDAHQLRILEQYMAEQRDQGVILSKTVIPAWKIRREELVKKLTAGGEGHRHG